MKGSLPPNWLLLIRKTVGVAGAGEKSLCKETKYLRGQYSCYVLCHCLRSNICAMDQRSRLGIEKETNSFPQPIVASLYCQLIIRQ